MKREKKTLKEVENYNKNKALIKEKTKELSELNKRRNLEASSSGCSAQSAFLEEKTRELDATKRLAQTHVNVEKISKEIYSTATTEGSKKSSAQVKTTCFKKNPESSKRMVDSFDVGIENFSRETLKEKITSWRYDESLQPFTKAYVDPESTELVDGRGANLKPMRMYELAQIRCLAAEDILARAQ
ncbi:hypothetical protein L1987_33228 [Smallanthus sonchifolius]|uniref:Uncharacterized protein n=1 Tax=Smallanthus sonchifolius TaxID=185202 RepID=A0ACB9HPS2_9ASTR|nr:hypothetical protein L1987_33228 [Smallanthus sonchifolius]